MSQFKQIVKDIALESEKCNYNPEIDMNWYNLPMEMRLECVKWMDFKTRTRLAATSKTEKSLVEAKKYNIDQVRLDLGGFLEKWTLKPYSEVFISGNRHVADTFVSAMFKNCEIENFWMKGKHSISFDSHDIWQMNLANFAPFRFKRLSVFCNENLYFFMKNCENLEKVDFGDNYFGCSYKKLLELPSVLNVKEFRFIVVYFKEFLIGLVQKWIENNVKVGKSVQFVAKGDTLDVFASQFADRIIEETDEIVRIRMNNEKSQILIRRVGSTLYGWRRVFINLREDPFEYLSCKFVPIDMPESEYATGDGWIQAVYEKGLKDDGILKNPVGFDAEDRVVWDDEYM